MSRYYREPPPPTRWDADRFTRERDYRDYQEVDEYYVPAPPPQRRPARPVYEDERMYYEDDRYGPRGSRLERQYFEEEDYYDPRTQRGQMIPYRPARPPMPEAPPRPGLLRRQSSLDTFDRPSQRRYDEHDRYRPPTRPQRINIDVPPEPSPRSNRYRPARPARPPPREYDYDYRENYDDVAIADPDFYGDDGFREYKEREWISRRRRDSSSRSRSRSRPPTEVFKEMEKVKEEVKTDRKEIVRKEEIKEEIKEKPYPRRGKTKMPKRLVHTKVLFELGYPFYEEGEKTLIIEKALGPDNIDEVFSKSREYFAKETSTTRFIEAPPPPPPSAPRSEAPVSVKVSTRAPSVHESVHESVRETLRADLRESGGTRPLSEAPRSVREWDQLTVKEDDRRTVQSSHRARSKSRRRSEVDRETLFSERKSTVIERSPSPSPERERRRRRRRSRHRASRASASSFDETEIIERKIVTEEDGFFPVESESVHVGPLVIARDAQRSERDIKAQIRQLEAEQRSLRRERDRDSTEFVKIERRAPSRSPSPDTREVIIERRGDDVVEVRKDRRERSFSRTRAPSAGLIKAMFYTAT